MDTLRRAIMKNCIDCKFAVKVAEHEYECTADQYDIDNKTCFVPRDDDGHNGCGPEYCEI